MTIFLYSSFWQYLVVFYVIKSHWLFFLLNEHKITATCMHVFYLHDIFEINSHWHLSRQYKLFYLKQSVIWVDLVLLLNLSVLCPVLLSWPCTFLTVTPMLYFILVYICMPCYNRIVIYTFIFLEWITTYLMLSFVVEPTMNIVYIISD